MLNRRLFLIAPLAVAACASLPAAPKDTAPLTLTSAFVGSGVGRGHFRVWLTGDERRFTARLNGRLSQGGNRLTVIEDFVYDDGVTERLTWVFNRTGPGRWTGQREDTVGLAHVVEQDGQVRLTYTADFKSPSGVNRLGFSDVIYATPDGIVNDAIVTKSGIPVAAVRFAISR